MARRPRWSDLSDRDRGMVVVGASVDGALRLAALADLRRRPETAIRGRKWVWATVLGLTSSVGLIPAGYFLFGRRRDS
ncbi:hypothetical protein [Blastococcus haudaquaticus]|uniref:Phospholipase_D-nuclease N-terminal n=1 Tax=Blastococcus haudaquaticus TaxID=1938745 RepID=A0A286GHM9_9ACTN|nr:hypothetical protein [Blastococcus haudaquaticus]SOD94494.1 hypothetical protein SAMN06272739_0860 [Blastococcus haudaquaticus]